MINDHPKEENLFNDPEGEEEETEEEEVEEEEEEVEDGGKNWGCSFRQGSMYLGESKKCVI